MNCNGSKPGPDFALLSVSLLTDSYSFMSFPRLKQANVKAGSTPTARSSRSARPISATAKKSAVALPARTNEDTLAREEEILSLLTILNAPVVNSKELPVTLQAIKAALYARDYATAFAKPVRRENTTHILPVNTP